MKPALLDVLVCPKDQAPLHMQATQSEGEDVLEGRLACAACGQKYPITRGIPRFVEAGHYSGNFGFQWNHYRTTQLDSHSGLSISRDRFKLVVEWEKANGVEWGLEAGCGAGRFTEIAAETGLQLVSLDASSAVDANRENNRRFANVHFVQADLLNMPFRPATFDRAYCLGVIQHTPDPERVFRNLVAVTKVDGGTLAFDVYAKTWDTFLWSKYWFRPLLKRLPDRTLLKLLDFSVPFLLLVHDLLRFIPWIGRYMACQFVPVCNYKYTYPLNREQNLQWAKLDTFDMFSPEHDHPKSMEEIEEWLKPLNLSRRRLGFGPNGIIGKITLSRGPST